jgi:tetratricopeptide (TPR) repeat protein
MRIKTGAATLLCLLFGAISAFAQTTSIKGYVKDPKGPVAGAQVELKDQDTGRKYTLKTDKKGNFFSIGITPGKFDVTVTKDGKVIFQDKFQATFDEDKNVMNIDLTPGGAGPAAGAITNPAQPAQPQQQPKLTEEQKKQIEETNKKNAEILKENAKIGNLNVLLKQAITQGQAKDYDGAVQTMEQAEQIDAGQHALVFGQLGKALVADKKYPEGIENLNKAIQMGESQNDPKIKPQLASYYDGLGEAYAKTGKIPEAIDAYNKEAEQDPTHAAQAYYNEGAVLTNTGKTDDANTAFNKAIQADPNKADAYYQRAINSLQKATVDKQGKMVAPPGTVADFKKYLELDPSGPYADGANQMLETLGEKVTTGFKKK